MFCRPVLFVKAFVRQWIKGLFIYLLTYIGTVTLALPFLLPSTDGYTATFNLDIAEIVEHQRSDVLMNFVDAPFVESLEFHGVGRKYWLRRVAADTVSHVAEWSANQSKQLPLRWVDSHVVSMTARTKPTLTTAIGNTMYPSMYIFKHYTYEGEEKRRNKTRTNDKDSLTLSMFCKITDNLIEQTKFQITSCIVCNLCQWTWKFSYEPALSSQLELLTS